nr:hypothetical protein [Tanacetum cinerariifolium]GEZ84279.1 hypothetical protein [Tanacetum cinerariifolium]
MITYLTKLDASEGFNQIIDFLNASSIKQYRLFTQWEIFNELSRMGYEKPSTKLTLYKAFFSPQWKFLIHTILQCMSAKRTSWNKFSSSMASAVICLGKKFNFLKYIFDSLVRNVDSSTKFYMYPRFLQLMISAQVGDLSSHSTKYSSPALTQKVFANMRRVGNGFSRVDTLLFEGIIVAQQANDVADEGGIISNLDADEDVTLKDVTAISKEVEVEKTTEENADVQGRQAESQAQIYKIELEHADKVLSMHDDKLEPAKLKEVVEVVTTVKLMTEVVTAASATITADDTPITAATLTAAPSAVRRRKGVVIRDPKETATPSIIIHSEPKSKDKGNGIMVEEPKPLKKQAQIEHDEAYARELEAKLKKIINWDGVIKQVQRKEKEDNDVMRYQVLKRKPQTEAQARKNMMIYLRNMSGFKIDYFKGMSHDDIRPIFKKYFNFNVAFLEKTKEQMEEEDNKALKRASKSQSKKATKKQKLDEEVEELKKHLQIVPNDEDDVYTEAIPLAHDLAGREKISSNKVQFGSNAQQLLLLIEDEEMTSIRDKDLQESKDPHKHYGELMSESHLVDKGFKDVLMIECVSIVETDMVIHTVKTEMRKLVVEIECFGMNADEFDNETGSFDGCNQSKRI